VPQLYRLALDADQKPQSPSCTTPARRRSTREVFVYFDNDAKVYAPVDAQNIAARVNRLLAEGAA
jgi:uncharacterized protein YecE (DUF72 family)